MSDREKVFDGTGSLTSGQFVRSVRQTAIDKDKTTDDQWTAYYASSRIDGLALEWLEKQTDEVQESWKLVRRALLIRWPPSERGVISPAIPPEWQIHMTTPTAAAAAPPPSALALSRPTVASSSAAFIGTVKSFKGIMRVQNLRGEVLAYLSKDLDGDGDCALAETKDAAQVVQFVLSHTPFKVEICGDLSNPTGQYLGWTRMIMPGIKQGSLAHVKSSPGTTGPLESTSTNQGESYAVAWCLSIDGTMVPFQEEKTGVWHYLEIGLTAAGFFHVTTEFQKLGSWGFQQILFVFEASD